MGLELKIIPVKPYVHMRYIPVHGKEKYCDMMRELSGANDKGRLLLTGSEMTYILKPFDG